MQYESVHYNDTYSYVGNTLMAFSASDIQSQRGYHGGGGNFSFNYADLPPNPVPASAWFGQAACFPETEDCLPIEATAYGPGLVFPSVFYHLSDMNPKFTDKHCQLGVENNGIWDPPVACQPASTIAGPSVPGQAYGTTTAASAPETTRAQPSPALTQPAAQTTTQNLKSSDPTPSAQAQAAVPAESDTDPSATDDAPETSPSASPAAGSEDSGSSADSGGPNASGQAQDSGSDLSANGGAGNRREQSSTSANVGDIVASALGMSKSNLDDSNSQNAASVFASASGLVSNALPGSTPTASPDSDGQSSDLVDPVTAATGNAAVSRIVTIGQSTVMASPDSDGGVAIDGQTYEPGQSVTVGSQVVGEDSAGDLVAGTSTLVPAASQSTDELSESGATTTPTGQIAGSATSLSSGLPSATSAAAGLHQVSWLGLGSSLILIMAL